MNNTTLVTFNSPLIRSLYQVIKYKRQDLVLDKGYNLEGIYLHSNEYNTLTCYASTRHISVRITTDFPVNRNLDCFISKDITKVLRSRSKKVKLSLIKEYDEDLLLFDGKNYFKLPLLIGESPKEIIDPLFKEKPIEDGIGQKFGVNFKYLDTLFQSFKFINKFRDYTIFTPPIKEGFPIFLEGKAPEASLGTVNKNIAKWEGVIMPVCTKIP